MPGPQLPDYLRLNRANGRAPHKPVLLLAVLKAIDEGLITENRITPSAELINLFNGYWAALVKDSPYQRRFFLPFYHLKNEPSGLWKLHTLPGFEHGLTRSNSIKSLSALIAFDAYAELRADVFDRWQDRAHRAADQLILVAKYFTGQAVPNALPDHLREIERQIEHDTPEAYVARQLQHLQEEEEEEQLLRGAAFKRKIPELYGYRCAITGLHIRHNKRASLIDACHIVPWADSYDDTITNGIALPQYAPRIRSRPHQCCSGLYRDRVQRTSGSGYGLCHPALCREAVDPAGSHPTPSGAEELDDAPGTVRVQLNSA